MIKIVISILLFIPALVFAHGSSASYEATVGGYVVDIGYEPESLQAGERAVFDFNLLREDRTPEPFDSVWVRVEYEGVTLLATGIARPEFGPTSLLYEVPAEAHGEITVFVRYERAGEALAETQFPLPVTPQPKGRALQYALLFGAALGGIGVGYLLKRTAQTS